MRQFYAQHSRMVCWTCGLCERIHMVYAALCMRTDKECCQKLCVTFWFHCVPADWKRSAGPFLILSKYHSKTCSWNCVCVCVRVHTNAECSGYVRSFESRNEYPNLESIHSFCCSFTQIGSFERFLNPGNKPGKISLAPAVHTHTHTNTRPTCINVRTSGRDSYAAVLSN